MSGAIGRVSSGSSERPSPPTLRYDYPSRLADAPATAAVRCRARAPERSEGDGGNQRGDPHRGAVIDDRGRGRVRRRTDDLLLTLSARGRSAIRCRLDTSAEAEAGAAAVPASVPAGSAGWENGRARSDARSRGGRLRPFAGQDETRPIADEPDQRALTSRSRLLCRPLLSVATIVCSWLR